MKNSHQIISIPPWVLDSELAEESGVEAELRALCFGPAHHGMRLDVALTDLVPEFSRSYLQQLIDLGGDRIQNWCEQILGEMAEQFA